MNMKVVMSLAEEKLNAITVEEWRKVCLHAIEEENKYQGRDAALDTISERIIIHLMKARMGMIVICLGLMNY
ncbi:unnamed protein product [Arctia plantaginis]|uniref:Uncharacterized protein n=1 Tax=Arctia plantaginis TaxID=874455 RepID=A0A8S0Z1A3_ARCPL|nr:unnamed protein product [Arctia plantaginis]